MRMNPGSLTETDTQEVESHEPPAPQESDGSSGPEVASDSGQKEEISREAAYPTSLPEDADLDLLSQFVAESGDLISDAEEALLTLETDPEDVEAIGTVFRAFHTVKGVSAFLELTAISEMAHFAESLLEPCSRKGNPLCGRLCRSGASITGYDQTDDHVCSRSAGRSAPPYA